MPSLARKSQVKPEQHDRPRRSSSTIAIIAQKRIVTTGNNVAVSPHARWQQDTKTRRGANKRKEGVPSETGWIEIGRSDAGKRGYVPRSSKTRYSYNCTTLGAFTRSVELTEDGPQPSAGATTLTARTAPGMIELRPGAPLLKLPATNRYRPNSVGVHQVTPARSKRHAPPRKAGGACAHAGSTYLCACTTNSFANALSVCFVKLRVSHTLFENRQVVRGVCGR